MKTTKTTKTRETTTTTTLDMSDSDSDSAPEGLVVVPVIVPVPVVVERGGEATRQMESMKTEMNEMRVRTAQLQKKCQGEDAGGRGYQEGEVYERGHDQENCGECRYPGCCRCWNHSWSQIWTFLDKHTNCRNAQTRADIGCQFKLPLICINKS